MEYQRLLSNFTTVIIIIIIIIIIKYFEINQKQIFHFHK